MTSPLWQPSPARIARTRMTAYLQWLEKTHHLTFRDYQHLHQWSIDKPARFWDTVWEFCQVQGHKGSVVFEPGKRMIDARFFPEATLNFAANLLPRRDDTDALVFWCEQPDLQRRLSWRELQRQVASLQQAFQALGVRRGDRIAACLANTPETVIAMLACASLGAIWCASAPDFGAEGLTDRFTQIEPTLLLAHASHQYGGNNYDNTQKIISLSKVINSICHTVMVPYDGRARITPTVLKRVPNSHCWTSLLEQHPATKPAFAELPFSHPLYILFSSGTTGMPKCIVHSAGGTLLQHLKEHQLHCDMRPDDRVFYYTTTTWMMWNWLISALASRATLLLYDGSPAYPDQEILFDFADAAQMTHLGTSAKFIDSLQKQQSRPCKTHELKALRFIASTGSTLSPEQFDYVYRHIKADVQLASISGGTDIVSCFVLGNPNLPVYRGEITCAGLGMAVEVWNAWGEAVVGEKGELVCTRPFPSMPVGFWRDIDQSRYHGAYFETYPEIWAHGDFAELTPHQGFIIHGRSDTTLNPGGVRIGSAEIYRQVEQVPEVTDAVVVGQPWGTDERILLFVQLRKGSQLDQKLKARIADRIRAGASARHVPAEIYQVPGIPRTRSGKVAELAVKATLLGQPVKNKHALANPEVLDSYAGLVEIKPDIIS